MRDQRLDSQFLLLLKGFYLGLSLDETRELTPVSCSSRMRVVNEVVLHKITRLSGLVEYYLMKLDSVVSQPSDRNLSMFIRSCSEEANIVPYIVQSINRAY